jgi:hypothetical protein
MRGFGVGPRTMPDGARAGHDASSGEAHQRTGNAIGFMTSDSSRAPPVSRQSLWAAPGAMEPHPTPRESPTRHGMPRVWACLGVILTEVPYHRQGVLLFSAGRQQ